MINSFKKPHCHKMMRFLHSFTKIFALYQQIVLVNKGISSTSGQLGPKCRDEIRKDATTLLSPFTDGKI